ncbi:MAG: uroporphyrinogen decarboxylase family protein [Lentisphaeria bacterium]|jgi:MtaA/CmuA family methyltransferase|nr:uroporphyrinogen decarboxylase family protein [Lentisphaeria bacterium]
MAYSGILDDIRRCAGLGVPSRVPVFAISQECDLRLSGHTHEEYGRDPGVMARVHIEGIERFDYDWAFLIPDDYMEIEPLGVKTRSLPGAPRAAVEYPVFDDATVGNLQTPDYHATGRMPAQLEALGRIKAQFGDTVCVTGNVAGPFSSVALTFEIGPMLTVLIDDPDLVRRALSFFVDLQIEWGRAQAAAGADAIWLGDCVATSAFISAPHYAEFALEGAQRVCAALQQTGTLVFYHGGETNSSHLELMTRVGADMLSIGERTDIAPIKNAIGTDVGLMGNLDGIHVLRDQSPDEVAAETNRIIQACKPGGAYIFNTGEAVAYDTPEKNIHAMMQAARASGGY